MGAGGSVLENENKHSGDIDIGPISDTTTNNNNRYILCFFSMYIYIYPFISYIRTYMYTYRKPKQLRVITNDKAPTYKVKLNGLYNLVFRMLDESIYYETIIDDTPIEKECTDKMQPLNRLDTEVSRKDYLMRKSKSVFNLLAYLMHVQG